MIPRGNAVQYNNNSINWFKCTQLASTTLFDTDTFFTLSGRMIKCSGTTSNTIRYSDNNGATWTSAKLNNSSSNYSRSGTIYSMTEVVPGILIACNSTYILVSTDDGAHWSEGSGLGNNATPTFICCTSVSFSDSLLSCYVQKNGRLYIVDITVSTTLDNLKGIATGVTFTIGPNICSFDKWCSKIYPGYGYVVAGSRSSTSANNGTGIKIIIPDGTDSTVEDTNITSGICYRLIRKGKFIFAAMSTGLYYADVSSVDTVVTWTKVTIVGYIENSCTDICDSPLGLLVVVGTNIFILDENLTSIKGTAQTVSTGTIVSVYGKGNTVYSVESTGFSAGKTYKLEVQKKESVSITIQPDQVLTTEGLKDIGKQFKKYCDNLVGA